ncbi:MAG: signal recognition particle-docking protein FtsY [candidate division WOR-3 bacterium]
MISFLNKLVNALSNTRSLFSKAISSEDIYQIEEALLISDVGVKSTHYIIEQLKKIHSRNQSHKETLKSILRNILIESQKSINLNFDKNSSIELPQIIMFVGTPGSGKTTTIAKLSYWFYKQGKRIIISASDTYRAAAASQLEIWAKRAHADLVFSQTKQDAAAVTYDTINKAIANKLDMVFIDTAGRLHTRKDLMEEAQKIKRICQKFRSNAPDNIYLVLDANNGQNGIEQAKTFHEQLHLTGLIITKLDSTAKGGIIIPIALELKLPIQYIGIGENLEDIEVFNIDNYINALLA